MVEEALQGEDEDLRVKGLDSGEGLLTTIKERMNKFDVLAYLDSLRIRPERKSQGQYLYIACPVCDSNEPHLWINAGDESRPHACWGCWKDRDHRGGPKKLIQHLERINWYQVHERYEQFCQPTIYSEEPTEEKTIFDPPEIQMPGNLVPAMKNASARSYLRSRGFSERDSINWDLHYADHWRYKDRSYKWRLFIPVYFPYFVKLS